MRFLIFVCTCLLTLGAHAIERKPLTEVDLNALTNETQVMGGDTRSLDLVWWIPLEFWEATFRQSGDLPPEQVDELLGVLQHSSVLAVVQADVSTFGAFRFYDKEKVMSGLRIEAFDASGKSEIISHTEPSDPEVRLLLDQMRPVLAQAMGNLGENFYFFPLPATNDDGERTPSPLESGRLRVTLQRDGGPSVVEIELPIDALFVPRVCPNGKPAHVSWVYCPWSGKKLPK